jgi:hypothetical protein
MRGVTWYRRTQKWQAEIIVCDKKVALGYFPTQEAAGRALDAAVWWRDGV